SPDDPSSTPTPAGTPTPPAAAPAATAVPAPTAMPARPVAPGMSGAEIGRGGKGGEGNDNDHQEFTCHRTLPSRPQTGSGPAEACRSFPSDGTVGSRQSLSLHDRAAVQ